MKINRLYYIIFSLFIVFSCAQKEQEERSDLEKIKQNNRISYPSAKMDSLQAIHSITKQKVQELLDLSAIYASGHKNTDVDSLIYDQINSYFIAPDSNKIQSLISELDSLKVKNIKVKSLDIHQKITDKDTLDVATFTIEYFGKDKKRLGYFDKQASYILKKSPIQFVKEFKFYFIDFDLKEKTSSEVTK